MKTDYGRGVKATFERQFTGIYSGLDLWCLSVEQIASITGVSKLFLRDIFQSREFGLIVIFCRMVSMREAVDRTLGQHN